jgi:hypothetical protein
VDSALTLTTIDTVSKTVSFTPATQGVTKLTFTAIDARGRSVTNTLSISILRMQSLILHRSFVRVNFPSMYVHVMI